MFIHKYLKCYRLHLFAIILMLAKVEAAIESYSTYKRMDLYKLESSSSEYCPNFVCEKSGLSSVRIMQILDKENEIRNDFANSKSISNLYHVDWSPHFARFARRKARLCLHHTDENNLIFETKIFHEWFKGRRKQVFPKPVALEMTIAQRIIPIDRVTVLYRYDELEDDLGEFFGQNYFNDPNALLRRGSVLQMGCDYVVQNNKTHLLTNLVCAYGILYFSDGMTNDYSAVVGTSCSKCDFYSGRPYFRTNNGTLPWGCLSTYAFLCGDPVTSQAPVEDFRYNCDEGAEETLISPEAETNDFEVAIPEKKISEEVTQSPAYEWPCLRYAIPLALITCIMSAFVLYQAYWVISIKLRSN